MNKQVISPTSGIRKIRLFELGLQCKSKRIVAATDFYCEAFIPIHNEGTIRK